MWPTGDIFFMESRSCISLCFSNPISWLRALLIEKKSGLKVKRAALRAGGWWYPAGEKHTHLCFYIICQPLTWTSHLGLAWSRYHDSIRSSRRDREEWKRRSSREREKEKEIINVLRPELWIFPLVTMPTFPDICRVVKASQTGNWISIYPSALFLFML